MDLASLDYKRVQKNSQNSDGIIIPTIRAYYLSGMLSGIQYGPTTKEIVIYAFVCMHIIYAE